MSPKVVHDYIRDLGRAWTGQGCAMEVGCWLGATSTALLEGLVDAGYNKPFWAFDRWCANAAEVSKAREQGVHLKIKEDLLPIYMKNVSAVYDDVQPYKGSVPPALYIWKPEPIEICLFDAPKRNPTFDVSAKIVVEHFIPGVTVFGLLDYYFHRRRKVTQNRLDWNRFLAPVHFIEKYSNHFTLLREFPNDGSCAFFKYEKAISWK